MRAIFVTFVILVSLVGASTSAAEASVIPTTMQLRAPTLKATPSSGALRSVVVPSRIKTALRGVRRANGPERGYRTQAAQAACYYYVGGAYSADYSAWCGPFGPNWCGAYYYEALWEYWVYYNGYGWFHRGDYIYWTGYGWYWYDFNTGC